jgi:hypothetical protein
MKESYGEGLASRTGPEIMRAKVVRLSHEALTGAQTGRVLSRVMDVNQSADVVLKSGRQHRWIREREDLLDSARSKTPACLETPCARTGRPYQCPTRRCERAGWGR